MAGCKSAIACFYIILKFYDFLDGETIETSHSNTQAPTTDVINEPIHPPDIEMPSKPNSHPPSTPPRIPTIILTTIPKPPPRIIFPAANPDKPPIIRPAIKPIINH